MITPCYNPCYKENPYFSPLQPHPAVITLCYKAKESLMKRILGDCALRLACCPTCCIFSPFVSTAGMRNSFLGLTWPPALQLLTCLEFDLSLSTVVRLLFFCFIDLGLLGTLVFRYQKKIWRGKRWTASSGPHRRWLCLSPPMASRALISSIGIATSEQSSDSGTTAGRPWRRGWHALKRSRL